MPELPAARRSRLVESWGIAERDAANLIGTPGLADYAEAAVAAGGAGRDVTNWVLGDLMAHVNETGAAVADLALTPAGLAELVALVADGTLSRPLAKEVMAGSLAGEGSPRQVADTRGLAQVSDEGELVAVVDGVLAANPTEVDRFRTGEDKDRKKMRGFLMGQVMAATKGRGNPGVLSRLLDERLGH
jgi:aspartyl-tRNA(Asn)/glutamyl-tRNA(Gln) amidotransferase subunit B